MHLQQDIKRPEFSSVDERAIWKQIQAKTNKSKSGKKSFRIFRIITGIAAVICLCFFTVGKFYLKDKQSINYLAILDSADQASNHSKDVELILSENKKIAISEKESRVEYNREGEVNVNSKKVESIVTEKDDRPTFNQLIVPLGKRSSVTFSDGTKIW